METRTQATYLYNSTTQICKVKKKFSIGRHPQEARKNKSRVQRRWKDRLVHFFELKWNESL